MIGADLALRYFWGGDGYGEVFSRISGYQKHSSMPFTSKYRSTVGLLYVEA